MTLKKKHTMEERLPLILAFVIPILIMIGVFAGKSIYPFGEKSFLRTDMYHQYAPFFNDFLVRLKEGGSLTYAWDIGLGSNYIALFAYYLSSPFNWLLFFLPQSLIIEFMTYLIVLKIGLCGFTMTWYLRKKFRTNNPGMAIFGICYALSGYMAAYSWNIMWLDCLWLAPLILLGLERLVKENKPFLYCVTLGLAILTNYYISIMLCLFLVLYFICLVILLPKQSLRQYLIKIGNFALFSLIAGGLAAVLLVPAAYALMTTASADTTFPSAMTSYFSIVEMLARHLVDVEVEIGLDHWPNLYSGILVLLFLPMYYMNSKVSYKEKIVKTILLFVLLLSFSLNIPNYIWHGFHFPNSLPARQSFLYTIILLVMCFEGFQGFSSLSKGRLVGCFWGAAGLILILEKLVTAEEFAYHVFYVSLIFLGLYTLMLYLQKTKRLLSSTAFVLIIGILVIEMGLNTAVTSVTITSRTEYWKNTENYRKLLADTGDESLFYRVEKDTRRTKNDGAWIGYPSASIFSSTTHAGISDIYKKLGLEGNTNAYSFTGATPLMASLLGVKYTLTTDQLPESQLYRYRTWEDTTYLYENLYTLPLGFTIPADTADLWSFTGSNPAKVQNSFVNITTGAGDVLTKIEGSAAGSNYTATPSERAHLFAYIETNKADKITATVGGSTKTYDNVKRGYLLDLGYCEADEVVTLKSTDEGVTSLAASVYAFNEANFIQAYEKLNSEPLTLTEFTNTLTQTKVAGTVTAASDCMLFTSIPYEKGWTVLVDGVVAEAEEFAESFLTVPLTAGTHTIEMTYLPEGLATGALISAASLGALLLLALLAFMQKRSRMKKAGAGIPADESPAPDGAKDGLPDSETKPFPSETAQAEPAEEKDVQVIILPADTGTPAVEKNPAPDPEPAKVSPEPAPAPDRENAGVLSAPALAPDKETAGILPGSSPAPATETADILPGSSPAPGEEVKEISDPQASSGAQRGNQKRRSAFLDPFASEELSATLLPDEEAEWDEDLAAELAADREMEEHHRRSAANLSVTDLDDEDETPEEKKEQLDPELLKTKKELEEILAKLENGGKK